MKLDILFVNFTKDPPKLTAVSTCKHADLLRTYVLSHTSICEMYLEEKHILSDFTYSDIHFSRNYATHLIYEVFHTYIL